MGRLWIFGYGSLMWRPGFAFESVKPALVHGFHRALCLYSHIHRGTPDRPGLVLGLDRGGACRGLAFEIAPRDRDETLGYLRARELVTNAYRERFAPVRLADGTRVEAVFYTVVRDHPQYAGVLDDTTMLDLVRSATGQSGHNVDYVLNTVRNLEELGIHDHRLSSLAGQLQAVHGRDG